MNIKRIAQYCCAALVASGVGLNIQNAFVDYGIGEDSHSLVAKPGSSVPSDSVSVIYSNSDPKIIPNPLLESWISYWDSYDNSYSYDEIDLDNPGNSLFHFEEEDCIYSHVGDPGTTVTLIVNGKQIEKVVPPNGKLEFDYGRVNVCSLGGNISNCESEPCPKYTVL